MANNDKDDKELNDYLKGNSELSNRYHASSVVEPPAHLDEKILSAAKDAVTDVKQKSKVAFHKSPWALPVSIAAMITLSVSLVVTMQQETGQPLMSEPELEMYDSAVLFKESVLPQAITVDGDTSVPDEIEVKQSSDEGAYDYGPASAPAALGAVGGYRTESDAKALKNEAAIQPAKKALLKEKARSESEVSEKRNFAKEQLLQSAPMEAELDAVMELKQDRQFSQQDQELMNIKALWEEGDVTNAKQAYEEFIKKYPDVTAESIKEILGLDLYQTLNL
jgi:hypothetical protein